MNEEEFARKLYRLNMKKKVDYSYYYQDHPSIAFGLADEKEEYAFGMYSFYLESLYCYRFVELMVQKHNKCQERAK